VAQFDVAPADEFPPGSVKLVTVAPGAFVGVYNCAGQLYAIEDRCSHDDGPLCEGEWDEDRCMVICPRHGSSFELATGRPVSLPAFEPVETYPVEVVDGMVRVSVD
jgi:3-phenylpropionate/trans-cinnamate dioxygenase ferredoxin subunit